MKFICFLAILFAASVNADIAIEIKDLKAKVFENVEKKDYPTAFDLSKKLLDIDPSSIEFFKLFVLTYNLIETKENLKCNELRDYVTQIAESSNEIQKDKMLYTANVEHKFFLLSGKKCAL
jgi:hypothetical protein